MNEKSEMKDLYLKTLGKHIRQKRQEKNITLAKLAEDIDIDDKHLGRIERGEKEAGAFILGCILIELNIDLNECLNEYITAAKQQFNKDN